MTGFKTKCNVCGVDIWMEQAGGKWHPEDLAGDTGGNGERHQHVQTKNPKPETGQSSLPNPPVLAEERVRAIAREEIVKFYVEIVTKYEKAKT